MELKIIGTHNPQDYFEGSEPSDLVESGEFSHSDPKAWLFLARLLSNGYTVIITRRENEDKLHKVVPLPL